MVKHGPKSVFLHISTIWSNKMSGSNWILVGSDLHTYRPNTIKPKNCSGTPILAIQGLQSAQKWSKMAQNQHFFHISTICSNKMSGSNWIISGSVLNTYRPYIKKKKKFSGTPILVIWGL